MPYHAYLLDLVVCPKILEVVFAEEFDEGFAVVLVDGFEGHGFGVERLDEVVVRDAPCLRKGGPGHEGGGGASFRGEGVGWIVEGF